MPKFRHSRVDREFEQAVASAIASPHERTAALTCVGKGKGSRFRDLLLRSLPVDLRKCDRDRDPRGPGSADAYKSAARGMIVLGQPPGESKTAQLSTRMRIDTLDKYAGRR